MLNARVADADATIFPPEAGYVGEDVENISACHPGRRTTTSSAPRPASSTSTGRQDRAQSENRRHRERLRRGRSASIAEDPRARRHRCRRRAAASTTPRFIRIDTTNVLFIVGGAFAGLREDRLRPTSADKGPRVGAGLLGRDHLPGTTAAEGITRGLIVDSSRGSSAACRSINLIDQSGQGIPLDDGSPEPKDALVNSTPGSSGWTRVNYRFDEGISVVADQTITAGA